MHLKCTPKTQGHHIKCKSDQNVIKFTSSLHLYSRGHVDELWSLADLRAADKPNHKVGLLLCHLQL